MFHVFFRLNNKQNINFKQNFLINLFLSLNTDKTLIITYNDNNQMKYFLQYLIFPRFKNTIV